MKPSDAAWIIPKDIPETNDEYEMCMVGYPVWYLRARASADSDAKTLPPPKFWPGYLHSYDGYAAAPAPAKAAPARCECGSNGPNCHSDWCPLSCR